MALTADLVIDIKATLTSVLDLVTGSAPLAQAKKVALTDGTGANKARKIFSDQRTLSTGANENLDLAGVLTDVFGTTLTFTNIKAIYISGASANTTNLTLTAPGVNGFAGLFAALGDGIAIPPDGKFLAIAPGASGFGAVTAGTADLLNMANAAGASATYDIVIIGE